MEGSGNIAIKLLNYDNEKGLVSNGDCCNGSPVVLPNSTQVCSMACNTQISLCIDYLNSPNSNDMNACPFGKRSLSAINNKNTIAFRTPIEADTENPVLFPFSGNFQVFTKRFFNKIKKKDISFIFCF